MRNVKMGDDDVSDRDSRLLSPIDDDKETMSPTTLNNSISKNITEHTTNMAEEDDSSVSHSFRGTRRRRRPEGLAKAASLSPNRIKNAVGEHYGQYSQQLALYGTNPTPSGSPHYTQQLAFNNSIQSLDWGSNDSQGSTSRKKYNHNASLIFDDDLSLSLHQAFIPDDDGMDKNDSVSKRNSLHESVYQLSGGLNAIDSSYRSMPSQMSPTSKTEIDSSSPDSTQKEVHDEFDGSNVGIWGRQKELYGLLSRFFAATAEMSNQTYTGPDFSVNIPPGHVWISGVSGIGKTSLVDAFLRHDNLLRMQTHICRGAFEEDWMDASKPFPGIISCFTDLFQSFLDGSDAEEWGERMHDCLDEIDISLLVSLIPSFATLLDTENDDTKYSFDKTDKYLFGRLSRALGRVLAVTCEHSSVIFFLDDVHWAGYDSLHLLKALLLTNNLKNFFFVGSHRSGLKVSHPFYKIKLDLCELFGPEIKLGGILKGAAESLVRSQLRLLHDEAAIDTEMFDRLMKSWFKHSSSRIPVYLKHLVSLLYEKNGFKVKAGEWILDSPKILPSSSLSLVIERIECLPTDHELVLKSAALLDTNDFNTEMLMVAVAVLPKSKALEIDIDKVDSIARILTEKNFLEEHCPGRYAFAHNVVKVAASSRIHISTKRRRSSLHWRIATDLKRLKDDALESETKNGFTSLLIANHLNKGLFSIDDTKKTEMVVKLYLQLAEGAMKRSAFVTASNILETGVAALDKKSKWKESYNLSLKVHLAYARCLFCSDELDKAKSILNTIIANGNTPRDIVDAFDLLISIYRSKMQYEQSKQFALKALTDIFEDDIGNSNVEEKFSKIRELVQKKTDADLLVLPEMEHKKTSKKMPFLLQLAEISGLSRDYKLQDLAALRMLELTLKYGSYETNFTGLVFAFFGLCVARRHLHGEAYRYGRLAEMMSEKENLLGRQAIAHHNYSVRHWRNNLRGGRKSLKEICRASMEENEIEKISFQVGAYISALLYTGTPFNLEDSVLEVYNQKRKEFDLPENWYVVAPYNALVKLKGENLKLIKRKYSEKEAFQYDFFFQMVVSIFMNDIEKADKINEKIFMKPKGCWGSYRLFMEGLIATSYAQSLSGKSKLVYKKKASKFIEILTTWTKCGMTNSAHMANILYVEHMIASDKGIAPKRLSILLDTAICSAYQDGFPHHAALASERAGLYFLRVEEEKLASKYLSRALILYEEWGAVAKVRQLESGYETLLDSDPAQVRNLKKSNSIQPGTLMFTDRKSDPAPRQRAQRRASTGSTPQDFPTGSRHTRSPGAGNTRSLSSDSRRKLMMKRRMSNSGTETAVQNTQSLHTRGRPVPSKTAKEDGGPRSKSVSQRRRPSLGLLVRVGSSSSIQSNISNVSDEKSNTRRGTRKKNSSKNRDKSKEKGKLFGRKKSSSPKPAEEKKEYNGPVPSPKPRKKKSVTEVEKPPSYLFNYDTDDFNTVNGDSDASFTPADKKSDREERRAGRRASLKTSEKPIPEIIGSDDKKGKEKTGKKTPKKKKKGIASEKAAEGANDVLKTPKRKNKTLKSKTLTL